MNAMTIGKKLFLSVGLLAALTAVLGITALWSISSIGDHLHIAAGPAMKKQVLAHMIATSSARALNSERAVIIRGFLKDPAAIERYNNEFTAAADSLQEELTSLLALVSRPDARQSIEDLQRTVGPMREASRTIFAASKSGDMVSATGTFESVIVPGEAAQKLAAENLLKIQDGVAMAEGEAADSSISTSRLLTGLVLLLSGLVGVAAILVVRQMVKTLRSAVVDLEQASSQIASASGQIAATSQGSAQAASEQAATIEETSSASSEINSMAQRNRENSKSTADLVSASQTRFEETNKSLDEMVAAMDGISASSQQISKIIKVIDEIAFQTNILALNAAVEAARAGDAGMGFAVVADEVRNLAQRSAQAAKDTATLIEESIQRSHSGKAKVDQVAGNIRVVTVESGKIKMLVDEINLGSVEQSRGIDQISRAISDMEKATQSSAANAEESAAAAEELSSQAKTMQEVVECLNVVVGSASGAPGRASASRPSALPSVVAPRSAAKVVSTARKLAKPAVAKLQPATNDFPMDGDFQAF